MNVDHIYTLAFLAYIGFGAVWLLPKKVRLMKRAGISTNAAILQLAEEGDLEAKRLKKHTVIFMVIGICVLLPLKIFGK